jgi:hypothetical protein
MRGLAAAAVLLMIIASACGPDNPFEPNPPSPSALTGVLTGGNTAKLSWTMCPDTDFADYTLYRSSSSGIQGNPGSATVLAVMDKNTTTTWYDENISGKFYYALKTTNETGDSSWSNEVSVQPRSLRHRFSVPQAAVY